jgi:hypothetical protein
MAIADTLFLISREAALDTYDIIGECDDVCGRLKTVLEAKSASFQANLAAALKIVPPPARKPLPVAPVPARASTEPRKVILEPPVAKRTSPLARKAMPTPPAVPLRVSSTSKSPASLTRSRDDASTMRSHLRGSLRSTSSR